MFKKLFKTKPPDFAPTNMMAAPLKEAPARDNRFSGEVPLPEVRELDSESAWAAFNENQENPAPVEEAPDFMETMQSSAFSPTLPLEVNETTQSARPPFVSGYQDILNEIEQDQSQRKRTPRTP
jgi:hypothetical protein